MGTRQQARNLSAAWSTDSGTTTFQRGVLPTPQAVLRQQLGSFPSTQSDTVSLEMASPQAHKTVPPHFRFQSQVQVSPCF